MIDLYCAGARKGTGFDVLGGCGIVLRYQDDHNRIRYRELAFGLGASDLELCDYQSVRLALASVAPSFRAGKTALHISSGVVADCLLSGSENSIKAAIEARRWFAYYKDIQVVVHAEHNSELIRAGELAIAAMHNQKEFDSLTQGA